MLIKEFYEGDLLKVSRSRSEDDRIKGGVRTCVELLPEDLC
jgi:hypothetical protein